MRKAKEFILCLLRILIIATSSCTNKTIDNWTLNHVNGTKWKVQKDKRESSGTDQYKLEEKLSVQARKFEQDFYELASVWHKADK